MLPCLRADFTVFETYADETPLPCPITAFGGARERRIFEREMAAWRQQMDNYFRSVTRDLRAITLAVLDA